MKAWYLVPVALAHSGIALADIGSLNPDAFDLSGALSRPVSPTQPALEAALAGGYTQGVGGGGMIGRVEDLTGPGGSGELQLGYRMSAQWSLGVYGTLARFHHGDALGDGGSAWGATGGVQAVWHSSQDSSLDPWISAGAGWRGLWIHRLDAPASSMQGVELFRIQLGVDYRITPRLAIAPVIAASLSMFLVESGAMPDQFTSVRNKTPNFYGFTGVLGRFDLGN